MLSHHCHLYFLQNDLVHGWGVDMKLGYCAQVRNIHFLDTFGGLCTILIVMQHGFLVLGSDKYTIYVYDIGSLLFTTAFDKG